MSLQDSYPRQHHSISTRLKTFHSESTFSLELCPRISKHNLRTMHLNVKDKDTSFVYGSGKTSALGICSPEYRIVNCQNYFVCRCQYPLMNDHGFEAGSFSCGHALNADADGTTESLKDVNLVYLILCFHSMMPFQHSSNSLCLKNIWDHAELFKVDRHCEFSDNVPPICCEFICYLLYQFLINIWPAFVILFSFNMKAVYYSLTSQVFCKKRCKKEPHITLYSDSFECISWVCIPT